MGTFGDEQIRQLDNALSRLREKLMADVAVVVRTELAHVIAEKSDIMDIKACFDELDSIKVQSDTVPALAREPRRSAGVFAESRPPGGLAQVGIHGELGLPILFHLAAPAEPCATLEATPRPFEAVQHSSLLRATPDEPVNAPELHCRTGHDQLQGHSPAEPAFSRQSEATQDEPVATPMPSGQTGDEHWQSDLPPDLGLAQKLEDGPDHLWSEAENPCSSMSNTQLCQAVEPDLGDAEVPHLRASLSRATTMNARTLEELEEWTKKEQEHQAKRAATQTFDDVVSESACRLFAVAVVDAPSFDMVLCLVIFVNCVIIGVEVQMFASDPAKDLPQVIGILDSIIFVVFLVELILRVVARGLIHFFWSGPTLGWNWFDAFVVATSILDMLGSVLLSAGDSAVDMTNMRVFRVIKVVRLLRVVRIARVIRYVSALRMLIYSMVVSLKSVFWALLLFMLIIYVCAIVFTQEVAQSIFDDGTVDAEDPRLEYWGSIFSSMFTLYKSICGGVDWHTVVTPLQEIHLGLAWLFACFIWFMYFVALNVITGVFCSTALSAAANDPEIIAMGLQVSKATRHAHAKKLFKAIDTDDSGEVTIGELASRLDEPEVQGLLLAIGVDTDDAVALFSVLDADKSGTVDATEFVEGCISLRGTVSNVDFVRAATETRSMMERLTEIMAALEICVDREVPGAADADKAGGWPD